MTALFRQAVQFVFRWEGGLSSDLDDPGGRTNHGISQRLLTQIRDPRPPDALTQQDATDLYQQHFWLPLLCVKQPAPIALTTFDAAVNCGPANAARWLQQALASPAVVPDGAIGRKTIRALKARVLFDPGAIPTLIHAAITSRRLYYCTLARNRPDPFSKYLAGWTARVDDLERTANDWYRTMPSAWCVHDCRDAHGLGDERIRT